ncbi:MAG: GTP 3',8-cyclase MoaA [SAR324 cluster bacterium]|nr:GTP 3',8-cyclase MoaA [SAR324 cluster bacterium]MCZ6730249.1 GTP 3',8-cyclase MoaA [SAR324 cluster bacterium]
MVLDQFKRPLKDLRISVTDKCNFRCPYCMPIEVYGDDYEFSPKAHVLTFEEITRLAGLFVRLGADKIRLTGGEPLLRKDLPGLVAQLAALPGLKDLTLTTNGWFLAEHAKALKEAGLQRITVSLDSLDDQQFGKLNGRGYGVQRVLEGLEAALAEGLKPLKVNAVIKRGENEDAILPLARRFKDTDVVVRYIEYMDVGNRNGWRMEDVVSAQEIVSTINEEMPLEPVDPGYRGEVAKRYRYRSGKGEIGVISSITQPFCGDCTRARLSTDGELLTCLFGHKGTPLRDPMRGGASDDELLGLIENTWNRRTDRYSEERPWRTSPGNRKIEMYQIGG